MRALLLALLLASPAMAQDPRPSAPVFRYLHETKVTCGTIKDGAPLASGVYGTVVNVLNPHGASVTVSGALQLAHPPGQVTGGEGVTLDPFDLPGGRAFAVDCRTLRALHYPYGYPEPFIEGFLNLEALQPLVVSSVWTTGAATGKDVHLTSLDVDTVPPRAVEVPPVDPDWADGVESQDFCDRLAMSSVALTGRVVAQSYTFDEAPGEGPREVTRLEDVTVLAGAGAVVGGPVEVRLQRGLFPDGRFLDVSEMPVLSVGERYLLLLPNHGWRIEAVSMDDVLRIVSFGAREVLVDQSGFAVTDVDGGRSTDAVATQEQTFFAPTLTGVEPPADAMEVADFVAAIDAAGCDGPVLSGPYTSYPLVTNGIEGVAE
ncbi:hypothetical protein [uncultured Tateyamaria sp.]|uniref:hypothetical protein n=1 Tax=uncultured Tateyamaria sp. TaxID=455651 RepID=UPI00261650BE|nr:hypothetical protein [uncultured Tateyamaria sp.]